MFAVAFEACDPEIQYYKQICTHFFWRTNCYVQNYDWGVKPTTGVSNPLHKKAIHETTTGLIRPGHGDSSREHGQVMKALI
jgi:hypothetical protein